MKFIKSRLPKHQRFKYTPQYFDAQKEDLDRRVEAAKGRSDNSADAMKGRIATQLRRSRSNNPKLRSKLIFKSNMLLLTIIVVLVVLLLMMINVYLPQIEGMMGGSQ